MPSEYRRMIWVLGQGIGTDRVDKALLFVGSTLNKSELHITAHSNYPMLRFIIILFDERSIRGNNPA